MDRFTEIETFIQVAESGSFASASRALRCDPSSVSRSIAALEKRLGVRLIARTTRSVAVTDAGVLFLKRCKSLVQDMQSAEEDARAQNGRLEGRLRVTGIHAVTPSVLVPLVKSFLEKNPLVNLELNQVNVMPDLVSNEIDVCLRIGGVPPKGGRSIPLVQSTRVICATQTYLERHGSPKTLADLTDHNCLGFSLNQRLNTWELKQDDNCSQIRTQGNIIASSADFIRQAALESLGICRLSDFIIGEDLRAGRLVPVFPGCSDGSTNHVCAVVPTGTNLPARTIAFIKHLQTTLGCNAPWSDGYSKSAAA